MSDESKSNNGDVVETETIFVGEPKSSSEDPPMSEWSSLVVVVPEENKKRLLHSKGLYSAGSGELCGKYICLSDSVVPIHPYYNYPAVSDPGLIEAILVPEKPVIYADDGYDLYMALCQEMNLCPVGLFYRNLENEEITISYYGLNPSGVRPMAMALQYNKYVKRFDLTDNFLNDDASYHLGQMLNSNTTLEELTLVGCRIGASGMFQLGAGLTVNQTLIKLNISRNNIGEEGGIHLANQLLNGAVVRCVNLSNNQLGRQAALALAEAFNFSNKLTHLDLSWNNFFHTPSTVKMLDALSQSTVLEELNLGRNSLEGERIADSIQKIILIPTLKTLDLSNNRFQGEAICSISSNLYRAKKLTTLNLSQNPLAPEDALLVLEKMLKPRVKIENLLLENINVNKQFMSCLSRVMKMKSRKNFTVKYGIVLQNWSVVGPDARELVLLRADYLGKINKRHKKDVALFFLQLNKEFSKPVPVKDITDRIADEKIPIDEGLISELSVLFPGGKSAKTKCVNMQLVCDYLQRLWPERKLPPTPPVEPEPEPEPEPLPPVPVPKGKNKKKP